MSLTAQTERFETLNEEEGSERIQCRPDIAQEFDAKLHRKGNRSKCLTEDQPVITIRGGRERREFSATSPVKLAWIRGSVKLPIDLRLYVPESTTTPAIVVPWPPIHLVALCTTRMSGGHRYPYNGLTDKRYPRQGRLAGWCNLPFQRCCRQSTGCRCHGQSDSAVEHHCQSPFNVEPTLASSGIGATLYLGLPMLSTKIAFVLSSMAASKSFGSSPWTNLTPMPYFLNVTVFNITTHLGWMEDDSNLWTGCRSNEDRSGWVGAKQKKIDAYPTVEVWPRTATCWERTVKKWWRLTWTRYYRPNPQSWK